MEASPSLSSGQRALRDAETTIYKIGGENAADLKANADLVRTRTEKGKTQILVISALRSSNKEYDRFAHPDVADRDSDGRKKSGFNTTSHLIALAERLQAGDRDGALDLLERVRGATKEIVRSEIARDPAIDQNETITALNAAIDGFLDTAREHIFGTQEKPVAVGKDWLLHSPRGSLSITGLGEYLAKAIYDTYFHLRNISVGGLDTDGLAQFLRGIDAKELLDPLRSGETIDSLRRNVQSKLGYLLRTHDVVVAGGYLPVLGSQRGYSDRTGALLAQAAQETGRRVAYLIEKTTPIMSADPKKIPQARVVPEMTYELAMEAFGDQRGADGGAVHPEALRMLAERDIPALVFNPRDERRMTHIHAYEPPPNGAEIVASRKMPIALEVQSIRMLGHAGFVHAVTQWFAERNIPIDQISTSEVTVSFTFSNGDLQEEKVKEFRAFLEERFGPSPDLKLTATRGKSLLFCMGNNMQQPGVARDATAALADVDANIHFIAQGPNGRVMTFMVDAEKAPAALLRLHEVCIEHKQSVTLVPPATS